MSWQPSTWPRRVTIGILIAVVCVLIGWDVYVIITPQVGDTISEVTLGFVRNHPVVGFMLGVVCGHLLWPQRIAK